MHQLKILNGKEIKEILKLIEKQWNAELKLNYAFLRNNRNRIFMVNKDINRIELEKLRINSFGMYFSEARGNEMRLSIEGSQIVGPKATKNVVEIDSLQVKQWFNGEDLEINEDYDGFVIVKHKNDFLGTGKYKDGKVLNYIGKGRRVNVNI